MGKPNWVKIFDQMTHEEKRWIAIAALERLQDEGTIQDWQDDYFDKWGDEIPDNESEEEHFYWLDDHKEDLRETGKRLEERWKSG